MTEHHRQPLDGTPITKMLRKGINMHGPRYIEKIYALIFLCLGCAFIAMGALCFIGIVKPTESSSVKDPVMMGIIFISLGTVFCIVQTILRVAASAKNKLHSMLLVNGTKIRGTVDKVYLMKYTQYGQRSPYRVFYTYTYQGEPYHHKSDLLWDKPNFQEGDSIWVYVNDTGKSTIEL